jgi:K+-transporting ATPase A subunit
MEGKETRFGISASSLFVAVTLRLLAAVNAMHDSLMPLGGLVPRSLMQFGEVVFGGWLGFVRDADFCHPRGIYCRPDDRSYA